MKGQASMIDILLLGLFISIVLVGGSVFIGKEELRAQRGREEAVYAQAQLITAMNYRLADWNNRTASEMIGAKFCDGSIRTVGETSCALNDPFYLEMQKMLNRTGRTNYNYIFYAESSGGRSFTVCNLQPTVCAKHIPAIATVTVPYVCPDGKQIAVMYMHGLWPDWQVLPLTCG
ncbi:MAG: hypothetical protein QXD77_00530 [Candidatus Aenigmatarchaeota archaeon]